MRSVVYYQIMKVHHTCDSAGWVTKLETIPKVLSQETIKYSNLVRTYKNVWLDKQVLNDIGIRKRGSFYEKGIKEEPYMFRPSPRMFDGPDTENIDYMFEFKGSANKVVAKHKGFPTIPTELVKDGFGTKIGGQDEYTDLGHGFSARFDTPSDGVLLNWLIEWATGGSDYEWECTIEEDKLYTIIVYGRKYIIVPNELLEELLPWYNKLFAVFGMIGKAQEGRDPD